MRVNNSSNNVLPLLADYLSSTFNETLPLEGNASIFSAVDDPSFLGLASFGSFDDQQPRMYLNYMLCMIRTLTWWITALTR